MKKIILIPIILPLLSLTGCGPHPASGDWQASSSGADYTRFEVQFNGRAEFYQSGQSQAALHCFWGGTGADSISLNCNPSTPDADQIRYEFRIASDRQGQLSQQGQVLADYRQTP